MSIRRDHGASGSMTREEALAALGLDVVFHRAEGDRLWYGHDPEHMVWDFLGGYGSTFFGHNHPELVRAASQFLAEGRVVHGQASRRRETERLREELRTRLGRALGEQFRIVLANTGSEAVELAARHAALAYSRRAHRMERRLRYEGRQRPYRWSEAARRTLSAHGLDPHASPFETVRRHNRAILNAAPVHLAVSDAYHGMTTGAASLTDGERRASGPAESGLQVMFVDRSDPSSVAAGLSTAMRSLLRIRLDGKGSPRERVFGLEEVDWYPVASVFLEPIQGEGGIQPIHPGVARAWRAACDEHDIPLVADEVQSGLGRTGRFVDCERLGIAPDYILLGKSLGGSIAKISAVCIADRRFQADMTLRSASTFADDGFSSYVARRALTLLDAEGGVACAARKGRDLRRELDAVAERHPGVVRAVRGHGLMLGVELERRSFERSNALAFLQEHGWLGYAVSGFLLRKHGIRVAPTLSGHNTIRLEPAYSIPREAVDRLVAALDDLCGILRSEDVAGLLADAMELRIVSPLPERRPERIVRSPRERRHVGFVGHLIEPHDLALWDPGFARLEEGGDRRFLERIEPFVEPVLVHRDHVRSPSGRDVTVSFVGLSIPSYRFYDALRTPDRHGLRALVQRAVDRVAADGCSVVGLGGYCSIVTRNGREVDPHGMAVTTGNGFTVAAGLEAMRNAASEMGLDWESASVAVIGATGNIGSVVARLLSTEVAALVLIGRPTRREDLERLAADLRGPAGRRCRIRVATDPAACRDASAVVAGSNQAEPVLRAEHLARGAVLVNDLSVPSDVHPSLATLRQDVRVLHGGVVRLPCNSGWRIPGIPLDDGEMFACMTETVLMGLDGERRHGSHGPLTVERVREIFAAAERHGFSSVRAGMVSSY